MDPGIFYLVNYSLALCLPVLVTIWSLRKKESYGPELSFVFWIGVLLGAGWEFPFNAWAAYDPDSIVAYLVQPPLPWPVCALLHSFWDGGIFLTGWGLVGLLSGSKRGDGFISGFTAGNGYRPFQLWILVVWGQLQELLVELGSLGIGAWEWRSAWWNPALFEFQGLSITLLPQLIWLMASLVFYAIMQVRGSGKGPAPRHSWNPF